MRQKGEVAAWALLIALGGFVFKDDFSSLWLLSGSVMLAICAATSFCLLWFAVARFKSAVKKHAEYFDFLPCDDDRAPTLPSRRLWGILAISASLLVALFLVMAIDCLVRASDRTLSANAVEALLDYTPEPMRLKELSGGTYTRISSRPISEVVWLGSKDKGNPSAVLRENLKKNLIDALKCDSSDSLEWLSNDLWRGVQLRSVFSFVQNLRKSNGVDPQSIEPKRYVELTVVFARDDELLEKTLGPEGKTKKDNAAPRQEKQLILEPPHFDGIRNHLFDFEQNPWLFFIDLIRSIYCGGANLAIVAVAVVVSMRAYLSSQRVLIENELQIDRSRFQDRDNTPVHLGCSWEDVWKNRALAMPASLDWLDHRVEISEESTATTVMRKLLGGIKLARAHGLSKDGVEITFGLRNEGQRIEKDLTEHCPSETGPLARSPELLTELGFLGTIIGILVGMASAALTQVPSEDPLYRSFAVGTMMSSLSLAFTTTLLGLLSAMLFKFFQNRFIHRERESIRNTVRGCADRILASTPRIYDALSPEVEYPNQGGTNRYLPSQEAEKIHDEK